MLQCTAFAEPLPLEYQTWRVGVGAGGAIALREFPRAEIGFDRTTFAADPWMAEMRWER